MKYKSFIFIFCVLFALVADLYSKYIATNYLDGRIDIISSYVYLDYIENIGVAFSTPISGISLKILTIFLIFIIFGYYIYSERRKTDILVHISFGMILGGALGNAYERIFVGKVVDFLGVKYFAVFNLADSFITIGAILYLLNEYLKARSNGKRKKEKIRYFWS